MIDVWANGRKVLSVHWNDEVTTDVISYRRGELGNQRSLIDPFDTPSGERAQHHGCADAKVVEEGSRLDFCLLPASTLALRALVSRGVWTFGARNRSLDLQRGLSCSVETFKGNKASAASPTNTTRRRSGAKLLGLATISVAFRSGTLGRPPQTSACPAKKFTKPGKRDAERGDPGIVRRTVNAANRFIATFGNVIPEEQRKQVGK